MHASFRQLLNTFEPISFASILSKISASVKFSGGFRWHSRGGGGGADIFIIDQIFNNHKNQISIESANVHKIVPSCAHRP